MLVLILLIISFVSLVETESTLDLNQLCPYARLCTSGPLMSLTRIKGERPCCYPCSCEDDCLLFGNCCPDKKNDTLDQRVIFPCRSQETIYSQYLGRIMYSTHQLNVHYRVVDQCPLDAYHDPSLQRAVERCNYPEDLQDVVFVSDLFTDRVYLNRHCAVCNGAKLFIDWELHMSCVDSVPESLNPSKKFTEIILSNCSLLSIPPENHLGQKYICHKNAIRGCSNVNALDFFGQELDRRCEMYDMPYESTKGLLYANVHCYLCHDRHGVNLSATCNENDLEISYIRSSMVAFTTIMSFKEDADSLKEATAKDSTRCADDEIFDGVTSKCLMFLCPDGYLASAGACSSLYDAVYGFGVKVQLGVNLTGVTAPPVQHEWRAICNAVKMHFDKSFTALGLACGLASLNCYELNNGDELIKLDMYSKEQCKHLDLLSAIAGIVKSATVQVKLNNSSVALSSYLVADLSNIIHKVVMAEHFKWLVHSTIFTNCTVYCPSIEYNISDIANSSHVEAILDQADQIDESTCRICTKALERILAENNASEKMTMSVWTFGLIAMLHLVKQN